MPSSLEGRGVPQQGNRWAEQLSQFGPAARIAVAVVVVGVVLEGASAGKANTGTWPREGEEWMPAPDEMSDLGILSWTGQSRKCSAGYGNFLADYVDAYKTKSCLNRTRLEEYAGTNVTLLVEGSDLNYTLAKPSQYTPSACARSCFTHLPSEWGGQVPNPLHAPVATPSLNGSSFLPLEDAEAVWDETTHECYCFGTESVLDLLGCDKEILPKGCNESQEICANLTRYKLPLGCLWTSDKPCKDAPPNSCLWTEDGCCYDSLAFNWNRNVLPPVWMMGMLVIPLFFISFLRMLARNLQVSHRNPEGDNSLETELIEKHKLKYEIYLQKLLVDVAPGATISQCSICLLDLTEAQCGKFPCGHKLHYSCMRDYIMYQIGKSKKKYPECCVCRQRVLLDDESESDVDVPERVAPGLNVVVMEPVPSPANAGDGHPSEGAENGVTTQAREGSSGDAHTPAAPPADKQGAEDKQPTEAEPSTASPREPPSEPSPVPQAGPAGAPAFYEDATSTSERRPLLTPSEDTSPADSPVAIS